MNIPFNAGADATTNVEGVGRRRLRDHRRGIRRGRAAVEQARLIMLVMINIAQLWILSAIVEAVLAHGYEEVMPLIIASGICWLIAISILLWWRPASRRFTSTGYIREKRPEKRR